MQTKNSNKLNVLFCGPSDTERFLEIGRELTDEWNRMNAKALGCHLDAEHWRSHSTPSLADRGQGIINAQLLDDANLVIVVFWNRFGTPTGMANSGTEEEIERATKLGKRVMLYFCLAEDTRSCDAHQEELVSSYRAKMLQRGLCSTFKSKDAFKDLLREHLTRAVHDLRPTHPEPKEPAKKRTQKQSIRGNNNIQTGDIHGTLNAYTAPPKIVQKVERDQNWITAAEAKQVQDWVYELADLSTKGDVGSLRKELWSRLKNEFKVPSYDRLRSDQMASVKDWYVFVKRELRKGFKATKPEQWKKDQTAKLKSAMKSMGRTNEDYYPELARRLKIPEFASTKKLTKTNLERVADMAARDSRKSR